ncbi:hypothetical protein C8A00DRAFT_42673 [Chaetomidium leptoderma]|uniref:Uncharacterized protein n=1 Tax=Chaetomidium leptoderma TaxID=669021 RepID=A0AAN6VNJ2_9PEZI|nr:hypothetical protein C8A00DRAFT_42673 [Chaetomidium leptoderma]
MEVLADSLARALNAVQIPCVLWGHCLWSAHGVPTTVPSVDLVVPDSRIAGAREAITTSTNLTQPLVVCPDGAKCPWTNPRRQHPPPAFHLHIRGATRESTAVCFFLQSETLWFLPPFGPGFASPRARPLPRYLALACDRTVLPPFEIGMGKGVFDSDQTVVLVPRSHILLEALMRIMARDEGKRVGAYAVQHWAYMSLYVEPNGMLDVDLLPEPLGALHKKCTAGNMSSGAMIVAINRTLGIPVAPSDYR